VPPDMCSAGHWSQGRTMVGTRIQNLSGRGIRTPGAVRPVRYQMGLQAVCRVGSLVVGALAPAWPAEPVTYTYEFRRDLREGNRGAAAGELQAALQGIGFLSPGGSDPKGIFRPQTRSALTPLQEMNGIAPADGIFSALLHSRLESRRPTEPEFPLDLRSVCSDPGGLAFLRIIWKHTD
jgi:hypothetical protein